MNLHEHQAKTLFKSYDLPTSNFFVANKVEEAKELAEKLNVSYTTGGVTLSASNYMYEGDSNTAGAGGEIDRWALSATFAF